MKLNLDYLHDVVVDLPGKYDLDYATIERIYHALPESIRLMADQWGTSDTAVRENSHEYLEAHPEVIDAAMRQSGGASK